METEVGSYRQLLEAGKGKDTDSLLEPPEGMTP